MITKEALYESAFHDIAKLIHESRKQLICRSQLPSKESEEDPLDRGPAADLQQGSTFAALDLALSAGLPDPAFLTDVAFLSTRVLDFLWLIVGNLGGGLDADAPLHVRPRWMPAAGLIAPLAELFEPSAMERRIQLRMKIESNAKILCDPAVAFRAIANVIDNGVKYSFARSEAEGSPARYVEIAGRRHNADGGFLFEVDSYGVGISEEEIRTGKIFEYGYRGHAALSDSVKREGSGIGLAEARRIMLAHSGAIEVRSIPASQPPAWRTIVSLVFPGDRGHQQAQVR